MCVVKHACAAQQGKDQAEGSQSEAANLVHVKAHAAGTAPPSKPSISPAVLYLAAALTLIALGAGGSFLYRGEASWTVHLGECSHASVACGKLSVW